MIVVTGAAGFIGSNVVHALNKAGRDDVIASDEHFGQHLGGARVWLFLHKGILAEWLWMNKREVDAVIHMGAVTDTTCTDRDLMMRENFEYTRTLWQFCEIHGKRMVYASSAATYGDGSLGFDDEADPSALKPLNLYGESKQRFDLWALGQENAPPSWAGLKFFNVYGPREDHKGDMASVAFKAYGQARKTGRVELFEHGEQRRDFVYVDDVVSVVLFFAGRKKPSSGLFNVGTGRSRSFRDLACCVFDSMGKRGQIRYVKMPESLAGQYQSLTRANNRKLRAAGHKAPFRSLERGIEAYVRYLDANYMKPG